jgi:hypothetical protein
MNRAKYGKLVCCAKFSYSQESQATSGACHNPLLLAALAASFHRRLVFAADHLSDRLEGTPRSVPWSAKPLDSTPRLLSCLRAAGKKSTRQNIAQPCVPLWLLGRAFMVPSVRMLTPKQS